eukprot:CAMPEP_0173197612 /NCGR_PEP_ID=MMETSP1141-20130122/16258_1 /TAXON_ID=483371 /ORGANISM="non described non described, Strain CCMP2298" /LENGTH=548 /DNA_ID=CAMNT_0014122373 /DNA_START=228 /DNA_END=1874 /DNA_ORIENTATION=+
MSVAAQKMRDELGWSESEKGLVLSSFYWGYTLGQIPASIYTQSHGAKWLFGWSVAIPSFLTLLVPMACRHSLTTALIIRVSIGFFESATFPAVFHFFPIWVPIAEKTFMIPFIVSGMYLGEIVGFSLSGYLAESTIMIGEQDCGGWPSIFYLFGTLGILWFPLWAYAAHESPAVHPSISKEELRLINRGKDQAVLNVGLSADAADPYDVLKPLMDTPERESVSSYTSVEEGEGDGVEGERCTEEGVMSPLAQAGEGLGGLSSEDSTPRVTFADSAKPRTLSQSSLVGGSVGMGSGMGMGLGVELTKDDWQLYPEELGVRYSKDQLRRRTPWGEFFTHPVALTLLLGAFGYGWIGFTLLSEMPSYLTDILGFDLTSAGSLCALPYLALFISSLTFGKIFDHLQQIGWTVDAVRRTAMVTSFIGSAALLVLCTYLPDRYAAYACMIATQVFFGAAQAGLGCSWTDIAPLYSSSLNSLGNTVGAVAGILGPLIVAACTEAFPGKAGWRVAFFLTFALSCTVIGVWLRVIRAQIVPALNTPMALPGDRRHRA